MLPPQKDRCFRLVCSWKPCGRHRNIGVSGWFADGSQMDATGYIFCR